MAILVVDDSKAMRMIVQRTLKQAGFGDRKIVQAANGVEALASIREAIPELVLSDWNMPEMNGIELLRTLKDEGIEVRFGFVTSERTTEMREQADELGASFFITKPFTPEQFEAELTPILA